MKLQVLLTYILLVCASFDTKTYIVIDWVYYLCFISLLFVFIPNKYTTLLIHMLYIFIITNSSYCHNKLLIFSGLIASMLWYFSTHINDSCYFYDLQLPKKLQKKSLPFFQNNLVTRFGKNLFYYNSLISIYKIVGYQLPSYLLNINRILSIIMIKYFIQDYYYAITNQPDKLMLLLPNVLNNIV